VTWGTYTDEQLVQAVRNSSPELLAHHLRSGDRALAENEERWQGIMRQTQARLTEAERIGLAVLEARRKGRKTVRVAELLE
jgi:hypothetical protein